MLVILVRWYTKHDLMTVILRDYLLNVTQMILKICEELLAWQCLQCRQPLLRCGGLHGQSSRLDFVGWGSLGQEARQWADVDSMRL
jgi:hypothetical protein